MSKLRGYYDDGVLVSAQSLENYFDNDYDEQAGGEISDVFVEFDQSGEGWGAILRGIGNFFRPLLPFAKSTAKSVLGNVAKQGLATAGSYLGDLYSGRNWREAGSQRAEEAAQNLREKLQDKLQRMQGSGQYGGNKALHNAVKLFSFAPTTSRAGCTPARRRRRRVRVAKKAPTGPVRRRRRRKVAKNTTVRRRRVTRKKKRAAPRRGQRGGGDFWL